MGLAGHRHALWALAAVSFAESSFFPIPPDVLIIPMVLAARTQAWKIAAVCTLASVAGGLFGYLIGALLYDSLGEPIVAFYGLSERIAIFQGWYLEWGAWIVGAAGFTPIPFKVITITSGVMDLNLWVFVIAATLSRGARFFLVAALLWKFGPPVRSYVEDNLPLMATLFFASLFGGFLAIRYLL